VITRAELLRQVMLSAGITQSQLSAPLVGPSVSLTRVGTAIADQ